ncbi:hypothetical protein [uncultured Kordia sp.]|uniref:hypothetical protein n=1 Tax=uncultured Kordia sp. TaxID=507699 RepID=UPI0026202F26|nr:hypothetical protein [uncultured Kordia sp.]
MKKKKLTTKLSLGKNRVSNLESISGGYVTAPVLCGTGNCGTNNCGTGNCGTVNCVSDRCYTNDHPASDPLHCRTCNNWC